MSNREAFLPLLARPNRRTFPRRCMIASFLAGLCRGYPGRREKIKGPQTPPPPLSMYRDPDPAAARHCVKSLPMSLSNLPEVYAPQGTDSDRTFFRGRVKDRHSWLDLARKAFACARRRYREGPRMPYKRAFPDQRLEAAQRLHSTVPAVSRVTVQRTSRRKRRVVTMRRFEVR